MDLLWSIVGLVILIFAGDVLVKGGVSLAKRFDIPPMVIGLTIIAFGTSAPELVVGIDSVLMGAPSLALGNVVGSNIANVLLVLGVPALFAPVFCDAPRIGRNFSIMTGATLIFMALAFSGSFGWMQGLMLLSLLGCFLYYSATRCRSGGDCDDVDPIEDAEELKEEPAPVFVASVYTIIGLCGLAFGADLLVVNAMNIARDLGISEAIIGLTLVAIGTSIPELVTSITATIRGHSDVAVGNVIGSNIFNLLAIIGVSSLFGDIPVSEDFKQVDLWVMLGSVVILAPFIAMKARIKMTTGIIMLAGYGGYIYYLSKSVL